MFAALLTFYFFLWVCHAANADEVDPLAGFLLSANNSNWNLGGNLGDIRPEEFDNIPPTDKYIGGGFSLSSYYSDYYRPGSLENKDASFSRLYIGKLSLRGNKPYPWQFNLFSGDNRSVISIINKGVDQNIMFRDIQGETRCETKFSIAPFMLFSGLELARNSPPGVNLGVSYTSDRFGSLGLLRNKRHFRAKLETNYTEDTAVIEPVWWTDRWQGWLRSPENFPTGIEGVFYTQEWERYTELNSSATIEPWGDQIGYHGAVRICVGAGVTKLGLRGFDVDLMAYGIKEPFPYAKITALQFNTNAWFLSWENQPQGRHRHIIGEIEWMEWNGFSRGHVEFWPFTSGLIDLLGLRRYFKGTTSGYLWRLHLAQSSGFFKLWKYTGGFNLMDVKPDGELRHWRPALYVFGKEDEQIHVFKLTRIIGAIIHLSVSCHQPSWTAEYSFAQMIPIKTWRRPSVEILPPSEPTRKVTNYGGGFHRFSIGLKL